MKTDAYAALLREAARQRGAAEREKHAAYARFVRRLNDLDLPVPYEQAVKELCDRLEY